MVSCIKIVQGSRGVLSLHPRSERQFEYHCLVTKFYIAIDLNSYCIKSTVMYLYINYYLKVYDNYSNIYYYMVVNKLNDDIRKL